MQPTQCVDYEKKNRKKNFAKIEFSEGGLAHGHEIFRVDAAFIAAHFPFWVVWGPYPMNRVTAPKRSKPLQLLANKMNRCAGAQNSAKIIECLWEMHESLLNALLIFDPD